MKKVLLAVEQNLAEEILANILTIEPYNDSREWKFDTCPDAGQLIKESVPDVLVLSRNLPGMDSFKLLEKVKKRFDKAHIVLLVWSINERSRAYMKKAEGLGLRNFVKGGLPGERPYMFTVALQKNCDEVTGMGPVQLEERQEMDQPEEARTPIPTGGRKKTVAALAYGGTWQSEKISMSNCKGIAEMRKRAKTVDMILISSRVKDAERCVKSLRTAGVIVPVVGVGPYRLELINAGATGCVEEVDDALKFLV
ncbi:Response regulator receiver domain protein [Pelotomaculum schinkii]|uniref:Response regulator receiver domain protein n=1 Tax=Pelotomaculum schinkii TaxID=78350 RepID=A0A4Y7R798_9FIRM|nr:response regulator [Pelotomaculum schinkii]TEB04717.1 Response regulator receiver domain protein [Pelotomaculum schinkii]